MSSTMRTFNVGFSRSDLSHDETQFDISDGCFEEMFNEIIQLFNDFVDDNGYMGTTILYLQEVPYDGEED